MFSRGRKKKGDAGSTTLNVGTDTESLKHSRIGLHKLGLKPHGRSKSKLTVDLTHAPDLEDEVLHQPVVGRAPEILVPPLEDDLQIWTHEEGLPDTKIQEVQEQAFDAEVTPAIPLSHRQQIAPPVAVGNPSRPISGAWDEAYRKLYEKNPILIRDFQKCLLTRSDGNLLAVATHATATAVSGLGKVELHKLMLHVIQSRTEGKEARMWKLNFLGHELAVRSFVKPVVGIIESAKHYVGTALEPSAIGLAV